MSEDPAPYDRDPRAAERAKLANLPLEEKARLIAALTHLTLAEARRLVEQRQAFQQMRKALDERLAKRKAQRAQNAPAEQPPKLGRRAAFQELWRLVEANVAQRRAQRAANAPEATKAFAKVRDEAQN